jgi:hypothetical protein
MISGIPIEIDGPCAQLVPLRLEMLSRLGS